MLLHSPIDMENIILFDGICNLCNTSVLFVIERDKKNKFLFASLQSSFGQEVLTKHQLNATDFDSMILLQNDIIYQRSDAALRIVKELSGGWQLLFGFIVVPRFIRNGVYDFIAKNRYKWFGKQEACMLPTPELKAKFIA
jgi:predicted DCC family thiol-disulfide oxidoreductase YuxK